MLLPTLAATCHASTEPVVLIGHYSNLKTTNDDDPHTVGGYSVSLYRSAGTIFGEFAAAKGSLETAQGRMHDIKFDAATGRLSFKSKPSLGWVISRDTPLSGTESRVVYEFSGRLTTRKLTGFIVAKDWYAMKKAGRKERVLLVRTEEQNRPESFDKWQRYQYLDRPW